MSVLGKQRGGREEERGGGERKVRGGEEKVGSWRVRRRKRAREGGSSPNANHLLL